MKVKSIGISLVALMMLSLTSVAQKQGDREEKMEKIKAMKVEYITSKLSLTVEEAQNFWPVYNEFSDKVMALEKARRDHLKANKGKDLTDQEVNAMIKMNFDTDQKILDLKREYDAKFKKVLSVQKVGKLYMAEHEFRKEMLHKMKGSGKHDKQGKGGPPRN